MKTSLTVLPKTQKPGPSQALRDLSIGMTKPKPKDQFINTVAGNTAPPVPFNQTDDFRTELAEIQKEAMRIQGLINERRKAEQSSASSSNSTGPSNSLREMSSALAPSSTMPDFYGKARSAMDEYIKSLSPTTAETDLTKQLGNLRSSVSSGLQQASEQAIPMSFITGQQQAIENRGLNAMQPYENELARLAAEREAKSKGLSARSQFESTLAGDQMEDFRDQEAMQRDERRWAYEVAQDAAQPFEVNGRLLQRGPDGKITELYAPPPATPEPFELSEGQSRYEFNPETGQYEMIASKGKTYKPESGEGSSATASRTQQVLDGFISLNDLTGTERQKVQDELFELGFSSDAVPAWFDEYQQNEGGQSDFRFSTSPTLDALEGRQTNKPPKTRQQAWIEYRDSVMKKAKAKSSSSGGTDDLMAQLGF